MVLAIGLVFAAQFASAQSNLQLKQQHQLQSQTNLDLEKRSVVSGDEVLPNTVVTSSSNNGFTTYVIQMGSPIVDQAAANTLENKISAQPGIQSVTADHSSNQVTYIVKDDDEYNSLESYFDIH